MRSMEKIKEKRYGVLSVFIQNAEGINGINWKWKAFMHTIIVDWREICYYRIVRGL